MIDTFQALAVTFLAILPGGLYTFMREQRTGRWGGGVSQTPVDRFLRFVGASAVLHALLAPLTYYIYGDVIRSGRLADAAPLSWWYWGLILAYVGVPMTFGTLVGEGIRRSWRWVGFVGDVNPAPRAWDYLFAREGLHGWVILRTKDGSWLGGFWAEDDDSGLRSYASGYPDAQELYVVEQFKVAYGQIVVDDEGNPVKLKRGLLVRWDEIAYLEFVEPTQNREQGSGGVGTYEWGSGI